MGKRRPRKKGMKTAYLKSYSAGYVKVTSQPNTQALAEYHERANSLPPDSKVVEALLKLWFGNNLPKWFGSAERSHLNAVKARLRKITAGVDLEKCVVLAPGTLSQFLMYWSSDQTRYFFVEIVKNVYVRRSETYNSRDAAIATYFRGKITWVDTLNLRDEGKHLIERNVVMKNFNNPG